jgi:hypothetical protein
VEHEAADAVRNVVASEKEMLDGCPSGMRVIGVRRCRFSVGSRTGRRYAHCQGDDKSDGQSNGQVMRKLPKHAC